MMLSCWLHQGQDLQHVLERFAAECEAAGMRISTSKSEAMVLDRKRVACPLQVGGEVLPQVEEFKYLGVLFTSEGKIEREIDRRIGAASAVMRSVYRTVVVKKELSRKAKLSIYRSIYAPHLTYGHELWGGVPGMSHREEASGKTQDTLEKLCLSAGLGTPRGPPGRAGGSVWGEGSLGISAQTAASATRSRTKRMKKMKKKKMKNVLDVDRSVLYKIKKSVKAINTSGLGVGSAMNQCEDREEGVPPSKTSLCGEHDSQTKAQRPEQLRPDCPGPGPGSGPSCVSLKSDRSMGQPIYFKDGQQSDDEIVQQQRSEVPIGQSVQQHQTHLDSIFKLLEENMLSFVKKELKKIQRVVSSDYPECLESQREDEEVLDGEDEEQRRSSREAFLKITLHFLRRMKQEELADCLKSRTVAAECRRKLKSNLQKKFQCVFEGIAKAGNPTLLNQIYTELYITEGGTAEVNDEHEVRQIETASRKADRAETTIRQEDIFKASPGRDEPIRTVMTKGVAGIGKTVLTQKFTLDWAEDKANQDIHFTFPFTFRELNVLKEKKFSLVELVHQFFTETKEAGICRFEEFQVVFIFDGLDECRLPLDFPQQ
ncbi:hypothetical protein L3Q82_001544 [Scortum barcoo]|uniref:Uncharacterized protein n=1 Tax=Scortum barcoo TaxID=214431 RepID=A0ACB8W8B3_9TELE|nr:hypothetical protein L3Q82_001544 [Scortum barcoo]